MFLGQTNYRDKLGQTSDIRHLKSDVWFQISVRCQLSVIWHKTSDFRYLISDVSYETSEIRHLMSDIWFQASVVRRLISVIWHQRSEFRQLTSEVWHQKSDVYFKTSEVECVISMMSDVSRLILYDSRHLISDVWL